MRRALLAFALVLLMLPAGASGQSGGAAAPGESGGTEYGTPIAPVRAKKRPSKRRVPPTATEFSVSPGTLVAGAPVTFGYRIDGGKGDVRVRIDVVRSGTRLVARRLTFGWNRTGRRYTRAWAPREGELAPGTYFARIHAVDRAGRALVRTASASGRSPLEIVVQPRPVANGIFPVAGAWSWGGEDARFGADRDSHVHQGQDVVAASGTPLLSPVAGSVFWLAYQENGAGHYMVIRGQDGRDYVLMHMLEGSQLVKKGDVVAAGQQLAQVGNSGRSSGPHLHFEIWPDGWYSSKDSAPIDPRPDMEAWAAASPR